MKKLYKAEFTLSQTLIPLIFICILSTISLGVNFVASGIPALNDGITIHNLLSRWIITEDRWSTQLFKNYFDISVYICLSLTAIYCLLRLNKK